MTQLKEFIVTERRAGLNEENMAIHRHTEIYTKNGELVVELCGYENCDTLEPPEWDIV